MNLSSNHLGVVGRGTCGLHLLARIKSHHDKFNKNISFLHFVETTFSSPNYTLSMWVLNCSVLSNSLQPHQAPLSTGVLQERILEWVSMPSSRGFSQPRD